MMMRKGVAFTVLSMLVSTIVLTVYYTANPTGVALSIDSTASQIQSTQRTIDRINQFLPVHVERAAKQSLTDLSLATENTDSLYTVTGTDEDKSGAAALQGCLESGTYISPNGSQVTCYSLANETARLEEFVANNTATTITIETQTKQIQQNTPFRISISNDLIIDTEDFGSVQSSNSEVTGTVALEGVKDPLYLFRDNSTVTRPYEPVIDFAPPLDAWTQTTASRAVREKLYFHWDGAPSFLERLGGGTTNSTCCGITSIVNPQAVPNPNNYSHFDHHYYNDVCITNSRRLDFSGLTATERSRYGLNVSQTLQDAVLPYAFIQEAKLDNSSILEPVTCP
jgi:hypothetical protein